MPNSAQSDDIAYQPIQKEYSYSRKNYANKLLNFLITLGLAIFGLLIIFFILLLVLNYFNIISLSEVSPILKNLPKSSTILGQTQQGQAPSNIPGTNEFTIDGTLEKFDSSTVGIKSGTKIFTIEYNFESKFYYSKTILDTISATPSSEKIPVVDFPSNVLKLENIGKKVSIQYKVEKNKNILETLNL